MRPRCARLSAPSIGFPFPSIYAIFTRIITKLYLSPLASRQLFAAPIIEEELPAGDTTSGLREVANTDD